MKKNLQLALSSVAFVAFALMGSAQAQIVNVEWVANSAVNTDLDGTAYSSSVSPLSYTGTTWNSTEFSYGTTGSDLLDSNGTPTSVGYTLTFGYNSFTGEDSANPLFQSGGYLASPEVYSIPATLTISGLNRALTYNLAIVSDAGNSRDGTFTISGYGTQSTTPTQYSPFVLDNQYVEFMSVTPDILGDITVSMDGQNGDPFIPVNGFQLEAVSVPEPNTVALVVAGLLGLAFLVYRHRTA